MTKQEQCLQHLIQGGQSFLLFGPPSSGKTTYIEDMFDRTNRNYVILNCAMIGSKASFLKLFDHQLRNLLNIPYVERKTFHMDLWVKQMNQLAKDYKQTLNGLYVFVDCIQQLRLSHQFVSNFYYTCLSEFQFRFSFVFCGVRLLKVYLENAPFNKMSTFCLPKPTQTVVESVLCDVIGRIFDQHCIKKQDPERHPQVVEIKHKLQQCKNKQEGKILNRKLELKIEQVQKDIPKSILLLAKILTASFEAVQKNIRKIQRMGRMVIESEMYNITSKPRLYSGILNISLHSGKLQQRFVRMLQNEDLVDHQLEEQIGKEGLSQKDLRVRGYERTKQPFYPSLIGSALYLATLYVENEDSRRFTQKRQSLWKRKGKQFKAFTSIAPKHNLQRIVAITEALQDAQECVAKSKESQYESHTIDYYSCFQYLGDEHELNFCGKNATWGMGKVIGRPKEHDVKNFMKVEQLNLEQYVNPDDLR